MRSSFCTVFENELNSNIEGRVYLTEKKMLSIRRTLLLCSLVCVLIHQRRATPTAQLNWTPVFLGESNQVDMWTRKSNGCACEFDPTRTDCACCVKPGGCQCGNNAPNKCAQCGLQQHCNNVCNATINQSTIFSESKSTVGQIKSPSVQGPALCWYLLQPDPGYRLELQIYRLVNIGRFNGTGCQSGYVHLVDEDDIKSGSFGVQICGENERFAPPVVLFADKGAATLTLRIEESTDRSQFLAHYSFTSLNSTQGVSFRPNGGKRIDHTGCDWLYQDFTCVTEPNGCVIASPGFPGLYPSHITCRYRITMSSLRSKVKIIFATLSLPHNHCATDYINVYQGSSSSGTLLKTLCSDKGQELVFSGPNLMLEFKSGASIPPYDYNGFVARLEFVDKSTTTELPSSFVPQHSTKMTNRIQYFSDKFNKRLDEDTTVRHAVQGTAPSKQAQQRRENCVLRVYGNATRSGHFDVRTLPANCTDCVILFAGQPTDLVRISVFNYRMNASQCQSFIEIVNGNVLSNDYKSIRKICSPKIKYARNAEGKFHDQQTFSSTGNELSVYFKRVSSSSSQHLEGGEYVDGAFSFIDEYAEGTLRPDTLCDVTYYGRTSSSKGRIHNHGSQHLFWNVEGSLRCAQRFIPAANQSIIIKVILLQRLASDICHTECGDSGCQCVTAKKTENGDGYGSQYDHLLVLDEHNTSLSCICGFFEAEWLPIIIRSWSPITVVYSVAKYNWVEKGFQFEAEYQFVYDNICGHQFINHHSGLIQPKQISEGEQLVNYYYNQMCVWVLTSKIERQLSVEIISSQNRPCSAWNISLYEYETSNGQNVDHLLYQFCPRDGERVFELPYKLNVIAIKLSAMSRTLPQFQIKWRSQVVQTNTRLSVLTREAANEAFCLVISVINSISFLFLYLL